MDLRGILNDGGASTAAAAAAAPATGATATTATPKQPRPQQQQQQLPHGQAPPPSQYQQQIAPSPSTPLQSKPSYGFSEYGHHPSQASPGKHPHQEYPPHPAPQRQPSYHAQSPYQSPAPYPPRQAPPPLQASFSDSRSPTSGPSPMAAPNPYGRSASTPHAGAPQGSYFPGQHTPELASPIQQHQAYPPYGSRESFASQSQPGAPVAAGGPHGSYLQSPVLQTPSTPGAPGNAQPYPHQRSLSTHSANTATPTSAHSQHAPYGATAAQHHQQQLLALQQQQQQQQQLQQQRSPVVTGRPPVPLPRQQSQPPGPTIMPANTRQSSDMSAGSFAHPSSPHSQRMPSVGPNIPQPPPPQQQQQQHPAPHLQGSHASPPPPGQVPGRLSRASSTYTSPIQHHAEIRRTSTTRSERDRSVSISPKTHVTSLPNNNPGQAMPPVPAASANSGAPTAPHTTMALPARPDRAMTPAKRKMDDRDTDEDPDRREVRQRQGDVNGKAAPVTPGPPPKAKQEASSTPGSQMSISPVAAKRAVKPKRYAEPPPWARSAIGHKKLNHGNYVFPRPKPPAKVSSVNGRASSVKQDVKSRHPSPETARAPPPPQAPAQPPPLPADPHAEIASLLGPWEPTIANMKPLDEVNKAVADFLFVNVIGNPNAAEIAGLGIEFEVEAKLGIIIDRDTNERIALPVVSECLLDDRGGRLGFRSSMTEAQHKGLNEYLNQMVILADPRNPNNAGGSRVQITYKHRREEDYYFELPPHMQAAVPGCVRALLRPRQAPKARVTYDQRTKDVLAKIIKARVADLHLHMPGAPLDCRVSVNLEMPWPGPVGELEQLGGAGPNSVPRQKDRLSYGQGNIQVDLTQVTLSGNGPGGAARSGKEHELEVELAPGVLLDQGERVKKREPHKYPELIECFVDNIRLLARKTKEF